jgi:predicted amidohydrolase
MQMNLALGAKVRMSKNIIAKNGIEPLCTGRAGVFRARRAATAWRAHGRLPPHMASVITDCGFNVVSVAGNHAMDWGAGAPRHD